MKQQLISSLKKLRLSGMVNCLEIRQQEAMANQLSHAEFLEMIVSDELALRQDRAMQRRLKAAGFRGLKRIDEFDFSLTQR